MDDVFAPAIFLFVSFSPTTLFFEPTYPPASRSLSSFRPHRHQKQSHRSNYIATAHCLTTCYLHFSTADSLASPSASISYFYLAEIKFSLISSSTGSTTATAQPKYPILRYIFLCATEALVRLNQSNLAHTYDFFVQTRAPPFPLFPTTFFALIFHVSFIDFSAVILFCRLLDVWKTPLTFGALDHPRSKSQSHTHGDSRA